MREAETTEREIADLGAARGLPWWAWLCIGIAGLGFAALIVLIVVVVIAVILKW